ncbi:cell wall hydrolase [Erwinia amylovora]|uniref:cell wall hydrolase n=1 Tax=Erwinia amylovora TaxID=552 RepID=UPI0020C0FA68|nr:cell wall hydrolase [Erwinia amylovora]MCK8373813.1 cell wall hydrolase [Erwinia amylovora]
MELFSVLATCAALAVGNVTPADKVQISPKDCVAAQQAYKSALQTVQLTQRERDAIARVTVAEAANQGDSGLAGVVYTVLNRLISGRFGSSVEDVVNAPRQFEPVTKAGGKWENLPPVSVAQLSKVETIINLALDGHLPDLTNGALFFQNPAIVGQREKAGTVSRGLTNFGGSQPSAVIKDHSFYASIGKAQPAPAPGEPVVVSAKIQQPKSWDIYAKSKFAKRQNAASWNVFSSGQSTGDVYAVNKEDN